MTSELVKYIADNFEVLGAIDTLDAIGAGSGFDATVWKGRAGTEFDGQGVCPNFCVNGTDFS